MVVKALDHVDARIRDMLLSDLAQRRVRHTGIVGNLGPVALSGLECIENGVVNSFVHATYYPDRDKSVNPHADTVFGQAFCMGATRKVLATTVKVLMANSKNLRTQGQLAAKARTSQSHISRLVNGGAGVTVDVVDRVAEAFGMRPYELLIDAENDRQAVMQRLFGQPAEPKESGEGGSGP